MSGQTGARPTEPAKKAVPAKKAAPKPQEREQPPAPKRTAPKPHRAGGWIDRGDGRGWELEE